MTDWQPYIDHDGRIRCREYHPSAGHNPFVAKAYDPGAYHEYLLYGIVHGDLVTYYCSYGKDEWDAEQLPVVDPN